MFTIFSIPKSFHDSHINNIQRNAIKSWVELKNKFVGEIFLLGDDWGVSEISEEFGLKNISEVKKNKFGTPLLDSAFDLVKKNSSYDILIFVNADIILTDDFLEIFKYLPRKEFLVAGQRWDMEINNEINFSPGWEDGLRKDLILSGKKHPPLGSDYFIFRKGSFKEIPSFAVGRVSWDNWMIKHSLENKMITIDASSLITVIHQNHDYSHQVNKGIKKSESPEGQKNILLSEDKGSRAILTDMKWEIVRNKFQKRNLLYIKLLNYFKK